jgi:hypothetical protein
MLVEQAVPVTLKLIANTTRQGTEERFELLRNLLGNSIIGSLWVYTAKDLESMRATYLVLPSVLNLFGIGSVIYLKVCSRFRLFFLFSSFHQAMIPQLAFHICPQPMETENYPLVTAALTALMSVIEHCSPRINGWRWSILDCVCKRWATTESNTNSTGQTVLVVAQFKLTSRRYAYHNGERYAQISVSCFGGSLSSDKRGILSFRFITCILMISRRNTAGLSNWIRTSFKSCFLR